MVFSLAQSVIRLRDAVREPDIRQHLSTLLEGITGHIWKVEASVDEGRIDLFCPTLKVVIETKARGQANPNFAGRKSGETQRQQLERYLRGLAPKRVNLEKEIRYWRALLTDGEVFWGWIWNQRQGVTKELFAKTSVTLEPKVFELFVREVLALEDNVDKPSPPAELGPNLLRPMKARVNQLYQVMERDVEAQTKLELWRRLLQGSGIIPSAHQPVELASVFQSHTLLVWASRLILGMLSHPEREERVLVEYASDGFHGWLINSAEGEQLVLELARELRSYDWHGVTRDVLKEAYHLLIDPKDRKEFGEFYTPDDLAEYVVAETLDDDWVDESIAQAVSILDGTTPREQQRHLGVLDPSCGSGTFLFHAARRIATRINTRHPSISPRGSEVVGMLVRGIDIHPVAVEMAKATLAMAIPRNTPHLHVLVGDALQLESSDTLLGPTGLILESPGGRHIEIPYEVVVHPQSNLLLSQIVSSAAGEVELESLDVPSGLNKIDYSKLIQQITEVIQREGNHVWNWHLNNRLELERLKEKKVSRLIGNPPWLVANDTPDGMRKKNIEMLRREEGVRPERHSSAKGDLASVFTARVTRLYLNSRQMNSKQLKYGWVLPGTALTSQAWRNWRVGDWNGATVTHQLAWGLNGIDPPLFAHSPYGCSAVFGSLTKEAGGEIISIQDRVGPLDAFTPVERVRRVAKESPYLNQVFRAALSSPQPLLMVVAMTKGDGGLAKVRLKVGTKGRWKGIALESEIEQAALLPIIRSQELKPFRILESEVYLVAPVVKGELLDPTSHRCKELMPLLYHFWRNNEDLYCSIRAEGSRDSLFENLDYNKTLSKQLAIPWVRGRVKVLYNKSGQTLRATAVNVNQVVDEKCYYTVTRSESEAMYLCGILNAPCMQEAWREGKSASMHYDKSLWRFVPIPWYDSKNKTHQAVVRSANRVGEHANPSAQLHRLDRSVRSLLPDYATRVS